MCKESLGFKFFVISTPILRLTDIQFWYFRHPFKGSLNELYEAKKVLKIGYIPNNYQDCWLAKQKPIFNPWEIEKKGFQSILRLTDNPT